MGISKNLLAQENGFVAGFRNEVHRKIRKANEVFVQPLPIRLFGRDFVLQFRVIDNPGLDRIDQQHLPWLEAAFDQDVLRRNIEHSDFGCHNNETILGYAIP